MNQETGFWAVFKYEFRSITTSKIYIWGVICAAIISLFLLMFMMDEGLPHKMPIAIVDLDNTSTSRNLIRQLDAFPRTDIKYKSLSLKEAREKMDKMEIYAFLTIPKDFTKDAQSGGQPKLVYYTNNAFFISGSLLFQDLKTISTLASASVGLKTGTAKGYSKEELMPIVSPIQVDARPQNNPYLNYSVILNNIIQPCMLQLLIFLFTVSAFGREIKEGTGQRLVQMAGGSSWKMMLGKLLPNTLVYLMIALLYMSVFYYYNQFPMKNGFLPMFFNYLLLILASQAFGVILFCVFRNYRFALSAASLIGVLAFSLVGFSFPSASMDSILTAISHLYPAKLFYYIYGDQALNGYPLEYSLKYYLALMGFVLLGIMFFHRARQIVQYDKYEL